jgi:hypothetical protein
MGFVEDLLKSIGIDIDAIMETVKNAIMKALHLPTEEDLEKMLPKIDLNFLSLPAVPDLAAYLNKTVCDQLAKVLAMDPMVLAFPAWSSQPNGAPDVTIPGAGGIQWLYSSSKGSSTQVTCPATFIPVTLMATRSTDVCGDDDISNHDDNAFPLGETMTSRISLTSINVGTVKGPGRGDPRCDEPAVAAPPDLPGLSEPGATSRVTAYYACVSAEQIKGMSPIPVLQNSQGNAVQCAAGASVLVDGFKNKGFCTNVVDLLRGQDKFGEPELAIKYRTFLRNTFGSSAAAPWPPAQPGAPPQPWAFNGKDVRALVTARAGTLDCGSFQTKLAYDVSASRSKDLPLNGYFFGDYLGVPGSGSWTSSKGVQPLKFNSDSSDGVAEATPSLDLLSTKLLYASSASASTLDLRPAHIMTYWHVDSGNNKILAGLQVTYVDDTGMVSTGALQGVATADVCGLGTAIPDIRNSWGQAVKASKVNPADYDYYFTNLAGSWRPDGQNCYWSGKSGDSRCCPQANCCPSNKPANGQTRGQSGWVGGDDYCIVWASSGETERQELCCDYPYIHYLSVELRDRGTFRNPTTQECGAAPTAWGFPRKSLQPTPEKPLMSIWTYTGGNSACTGCIVGLGAMVTTKRQRPEMCYAAIMSQYCGEKPNMKWSGYLSLYPVPQEVYDVSKLSPPISDTVRTSVYSYAALIDNDVNYACLDPVLDVGAPAQNRWVALAFSKATKPELSTAQLKCPVGAVISVTETRVGASALISAPAPAAVSLAAAGKNSAAVSFATAGITADQLSKGGYTLRVTYTCNCGIGLYPKPASDATSGQASCRPCAAGSYRNGTMMSCFPCPSGSTSDAAGTSCSWCKPGAYAWNNQCVPCPPGHYNASFGAAFCDACGEGSIATTSGSTACAPCPRGTKAASSVAVECIKIDAGEYDDGSGAKLCPPGSFSSAPGATACERCPPGTFARDEGASYCGPCGLGSFASASGAARCTPCPEDAGTTAGLGSDSPADCVAPPAPVDYDAIDAAAAAAAAGGGSGARAARLTCDEVLMLGVQAKDSALRAAVLASRKLQLGNGICNRGPWNTALCGYDGGDCCAQSCALPPALAAAPASGFLQTTTGSAIEIDTSSWVNASALGKFGAAPRAYDVKGWPDPDASWVWSRAPRTCDEVYFFSVITAPAGGLNATVYLAAETWAVASLNGASSANVTGWAQAAAWGPVQFRAGPNVLQVRAGASFGTAGAACTSGAVGLLLSVVASSKDAPVLVRSDAAWRTSAAPLSVSFGGAGLVAALIADADSAALPPLPASASFGQSCAPSTLACIDPRYSGKAVAVASADCAVAVAGPGAPAFNSTGRRALGLPHSQRQRQRQRRALNSTAPAALDDPRVGDGTCDLALNVAETAWDGGDCCWQTCKGSSDCSVEFYNCSDPGAVDRMPPKIRFSNGQKAYVELYTGVGGLPAAPRAYVSDNDPCFDGLFSLTEEGSSTFHSAKLACSPNCVNVTRTWRVRDAAGNEASATMVLTYDPTAATETQGQGLGAGVITGAVLLSLAVVAAAGAAFTVYRKRERGEQAANVDGVELAVSAPTVQEVASSTPDPTWRTSWKKFMSASYYGDK